ncbi:MAG: hypothetical protein R3B91_18200 [Planctomycetaceae bacterium]
MRLTVFLRHTVDDRTLVFADLFLPEAGAGENSRSTCRTFLRKTSPASPDRSYS